MTYFAGSLPEEFETLDDLKEKYGTSPNIQVEIIFNDLKQEAIKWIQEDIQWTGNKSHPLIKKWIKRLNVTGEDLK